MKRALHVVLPFVVVASVALAPLRALAAGTAGEDAGDGGAADDASSAAAVPIACDGSLCDTTSGSTCGVGKLRGRAAPLEPSSVIAVLGAVVAAIARRCRTLRAEEPQ